MISYVKENKGHVLLHQSWCSISLVLSFLSRFHSQCLFHPPFISIPVISQTTFWVQSSVIHLSIQTTERRGLLIMRRWDWLSHHKNNSSSVADRVTVSSQSCFWWKKQENKSLSLSETWLQSETSSAQDNWSSKWWGRYGSLLMFEY